MERIRRIQKHPLFMELCAKIELAEEERPFCGHTIGHFLDVARLMYIYCLEDGSSLDKELIYAAALLHDLGRYEQMTKGTPHHLAGAAIASRVMEECGFDQEEIKHVCAAITGHRDKQSAESTDPLTSYLYKADKKSRSCFCCPAERECDWPLEKKNLFIDL